MSKKNRHPDKREENAVTEPNEVSVTAESDHWAPEEDPEGPTREEIAVRAYQCWQERECSDGTAEDDWYRAEQELRRAKTRAQSKAQSASGS